MGEPRGCGERERHLRPIADLRGHILAAVLSYEHLGDRVDRHDLVEDFVSHLTRQIPFKEDPRIFEGAVQSSRPFDRAGDHFPNRFRLRDSNLDKARFAAGAPDMLCGFLAELAVEVGDDNPGTLPGER